VVLDPESSRFTWSDAEGAPPTRMRWFLREGWGRPGPLRPGPLAMRAPAATVLPAVRAPAEGGGGGGCRMWRASPVTLALGVNGHAVGSWRVGPRGNGAGLPRPRALSSAARQPSDPDVLRTGAWVRACSRSRIARPSA
jgi:hypothetical protein